MKRPPIRPLIWVALFSLLALWVALRLHTFSIWKTVRLPDGQAVRMPDGYGAVDHPFHTVRAETLRRALADGHLLRWVSHHQGGYPVEFYPLGAAGLEVGLWTLLGGALPMAAVHKIAVWLIFLLPGVGFLLLARRDRTTSGVALVALAIHVAVRGWWWSGGSMELIEWGLITNVAGATAAFLFLPLATSFLSQGRARDGVGAAFFAALAIYANPRSAIALGAAALGAAAAQAVPGIDVRPRLRAVVTRIVWVAAVAAMISAPELLSLARFHALYYFVRYEQYVDLGAYWRSSIEAVSGPVAVAASAGLILGMFVKRLQARAVATTLIIYAAVTVALTLASADGNIAQQLETTRLMPFQRYLAIYLAALAIMWVAEWVRRAAGAPLIARDAACVAIAALVLVVYVMHPVSLIPDKDRSLLATPTSATPSVADLRTAIQVADAEAPPSTAIYIVGSPLDSPLTWHTQLWAPLWTSRPLFYDDWLWYWQTWHIGPYNPFSEHAYDATRMPETLTPEFLTRHGIGAVVLAETARSQEAALAARSAPNLNLIRGGMYAVYVVRNARTLATVGERNLELTIADPGHLRFIGESDGGTAIVRVNWFPRWRATVNGRPVPVSRQDDGYLALPVPDGLITLDITYAVDGWDWFGRLLCVSGAIAACLWLVRGRAAVAVAAWT